MILVTSGVDEAGRGCVIGDLYIAIVCTTDQTAISHLASIGVTDSKKIKQKKRVELYAEIKKYCYIEVIRISPKEIDSGNINQLELEKTAILINNAIKKYEDCLLEDPCFKVVVDCPIKNTLKYSHAMLSFVNSRDLIVNVVSEHKADINHVIVGAASIAAKVEREWSIEFIKKKYVKEYGDIGSGYPSDIKTRMFLSNFFVRNSVFPKEVRLKWETVNEIRKEASASEPKEDRK